MRTSTRLRLSFSLTVMQNYGTFAGRHAAPSKGGLIEYLFDDFLGGGLGAQPVGLVALTRWPVPPRHDLALLMV